MNYLENIVQELDSTALEVIASKNYEYNGTTVTAEMSIIKDKSTGEVLNGSCYAHYNGIFYSAQNYQDAIRIAQEIIEAWKAGKDYGGGKMI